MNTDIQFPPVYLAVVAAAEELHRLHPGGVGSDVHGLNAWERLSLQEKREALPLVLAAYVGRVHEEENAQHLQRAAEDRTHTYLEEFDVASLWDSAVSGSDGQEEVAAHRDALRNVLCELELLQHRLAMRDAENT